MRSPLTSAVGLKPSVGKHISGKSAQGRRWRLPTSRQTLPAPTPRPRRAPCFAWLTRPTHSCPTLSRRRAAGTIQTAFVERLDLTVRHSVTALTSRTWGSAQSSGELMFHLEWWMACYHFARPHTSLGEPLAELRHCVGNRLHQRRHPRTPAQAIGVADHRWTIVELLRGAYPLPRAVG